MENKSLLRQIWFYGICMIVGGLFFLIWSIAILIPYHQKGKNLYEYNFDDIPVHSRVYGNAFAVLDYCAEKYSTTMGIRSSSVSDAVYCLIPVYKDDGEEYFIMLQVDGGKEAQYDKLINATQDYLLGKTDKIQCQSIYFGGLLDDASAETYEYAKQWFRESGYYATNAQIEKYVLPYCINTTSGDLIAIHIMPLLGLGMLAFGIFIVVAMVKDKNSPKELRMTSVNLNGKEYPIHDFDNVDRLLQKDKKAAAVVELSKITGMTYEKSVEILDKWYLYYY